MKGARRQAKVRGSNTVMRSLTDVVIGGGRKAEFQRQTPQRGQPPPRSSGPREVLVEAEGFMFSPRGNSLRIVSSRCSPEGSHTDDTSQEHHTPHRHAKPPQPANPNSDPHEFDDEFDDDDPLPVIGHCKALYGFNGENKLRCF